jgi:ribonuclease HI
VAERKKTVHIYTDGGCQPNPGVGGWGAVLMYGDHYRELSGGEGHTTNNRMELLAAIRALSALKRPCAVRMHTDSQYLQRGISEWLPKWKRKGWKRGRGVVKNMDLWQELDALNERHDVTWEWVRGHAGDVFNERCDELAGAAIAQIRRNGKAKTP